MMYGLKTRRLSMGRTKRRGVGLMAWGAAVVALLSGAAGCARQPAGSAEGLPLRRGVIYRNGVGYFERGGAGKAARVNFKGKGGGVGAFPRPRACVEAAGA